MHEKTETKNAENRINTQCEGFLDIEPIEEDIEEIIDEE